MNLNNEKKGMSKVTERILQRQDTWIKCEGPSSVTQRHQSVEEHSEGGIPEPDTAVHHDEKALLIR